MILFDQLIADGQSAGTFIVFTALSLPNVIRNVLPVAAFIGSVYVANRMISESELVVAQAAGFSPWRIMRSVWVFGLLIALLMMTLVHVLVPLSRVELAERARNIDINVTSRMLAEGQFQHPARGVTIFAQEVLEGGELREFFISDQSDPEVTRVYTAPRGYLVLIGPERSPTLVMVNGITQTITHATKTLDQTSFRELSYDLGTLRGDLGPRVPDIREFSTDRLFAATPEDQELTKRSRDWFIYEAHLRIVQPFSPLVASALGVSAMLLGSYSRFGQWRQIGIAVLVLVGMQIAENLAADAIRSDARTWPAIYLTYFLGLAASGVMLAIASRKRRPSDMGRTLHGGAG